MRKKCAVCPAEFEAKRSTAKYCSRKCSVRASRLPKPSASPSPAAAGGVEAVTEAELAVARRLETPAGRSALVLARRIDESGGETGGGLASLVRQLHATLAEALAGADAKPRKTDELKARRDRKLAAG